MFIIPFHYLSIDVENYSKYHSGSIQFSSAHDGSSVLKTQSGPYKYNIYILFNVELIVNLNVNTLKYTFFEKISNLLKVFGSPILYGPYRLYDNIIIPAYSIF